MVTMSLNLAEFPLVEVGQVTDRTEGTVNHAARGVLVAGSSRLLGLDMVFNILQINLLVL